MRESRTYGSGRGACDETHVPTATGATVATAMTPHRTETFPPVTLAHIRGHGCRDLLVYCESTWCNHSATMNAHWLPDETPIRSLGARMVCTACGLVGADVRPDWSPHTNKPRPGSQSLPRNPRFVTRQSGQSLSSLLAESWSR